MRRLDSLFLLAALFVAQCVQADAVVFMYHRFGENGFPSTNIRLEQFDAQLDHLQEAGYQVWPLERIADHLRRQEPLPDKTVAITVDDAYLSVYEHAWPRLKARGWPFTVFVSSDPVDQKLKAYMSWNQLRELARNGVTLANHGASHDYLVQRRPGEAEGQWLQRVGDDIRRGQQRLEQELGSAPMLFAYPYGEYDRALGDLVRNLGYIGFGQHSGAIGNHADLRALPRYPMAEPFANMSQFQTKAASVALAVTTVSPWDPVLKSAAPPRLELELGRTVQRAAEITCFATDHGKLAIEWIEPGRRFAIQAPAGWSSRRARYNCTAPTNVRGRYAWYSHPWINPAIAE